MLQAIQKSITELKANNNTTLIAGTNPPPTIQNPPQIIKLSNTQDNNMDFNKIKDNTSSKEETVTTMIISPENNKTTKDKKTNMTTNNNQNETELLQSQNPIIQDHINETRNDRKGDANITRLIHNQSPEKKLILPSQQKSLQIETNNETDV